MISDARVLPVDRLVAAYNFLLAVVWLATGSASRYVWVAVALHLAGGVLPALLVRLPSRLPKPAKLLRDLYPMLMMPAFWTEIDVLFPLRHTDTFDGLVFGIEQALFGGQLAETWMPSAPYPWLSEVMHFLYFAYYGVVYLPLLYVAVSGRVQATQDMVWRFMVAYLSCYVVFLFFPVDGPHFLLDHYQGELTNGFFYNVVAFVQAAGDSRGCAFPSSHVIGSVTSAYLAWRWLPRPVAILLSVEALGVAVSAVYTQNHYAVDSVVAIVWALALQILVLPLLQRTGSAGAETSAG